MNRFFKTERMECVMQHVQYGTVQEWLDWIELPFVLRDDVHGAGSRTF